MARALRIFAWTLLALVLLVAVGLFAATRLIDPNDFKPAITEAAREQASLELDIQGQLAWSFWPSLGVTVGRTESRIVGQERLFAAIEDARVSVAVWPLLFGEVRLDGLRLDGLELNLVQTASGPNWENIGPADGAAAKEQPPETAKTTKEEPLVIPVTIPELAVTNGRISYRDTTTATDILVEHLNLQARDLSLTESFPATLSLRYQDQADVRVDLELDTVVALNMDQQVCRLDPMTLNASVAGITTMPVDISLEQSLEANLDQEVLAVRDLVLRAAGTRTHGSLDLSQWSSRLQLAGELHTDPFDANDALKAIGESPIETSDPEALGKVALDAHFSGPPNSVIAEPLVLTLDDSTLRGHAGLANLDTGEIIAKLTLDRVTLDRYLPPAAESEATTTTEPLAGGGAGPALSEAPLLPLETLRPLHIDARLMVKTLQFRDIEAGNMEFALRAKDGLVELHKGQGRALGGTFDITARLDASTDTPTWQSTQSLRQMQIQPAVQMALDRDLLTGLLSLDASMEAIGNSEKALMDSATGQATLDLKEGTLRGVNFHNTLVAGMNDMLGAYQTLTTFLPAKDSGKLPRELSEDTHIVDLHAESRLEKKVAYVETLKAELRKGTLTGNGWMNIDNQQFDFTLGMKSPEFSDNKYFAGRTWPIRCEGDLAGDPADWCRPDSKGFRQMGKDIAARATKEKIREELGVEAEGDTTEEVLKNAAEEKAKEELKKKVEDKLKDLFR